MSDLEALAELQELDTRLDQLAHRREHLSERTTLIELATERAAIDKVIASTGAQRHDLEREQRRLEDEVATLEAKKKADNDRMYTMTSPKDLSALQHDIESLGRRQETIEDQILELMEQIEPLSTELADRDRRCGDIETETGRMEAAIAVAEAEIDAEMAALTNDRAATIPRVREDLLERYTKLRERSRTGIVIGRIGDARCSACGLRFSSVFLDEVKHSDRSELYQCEECGVLLVP